MTTTRKRGTDGKFTKKDDDKFITFGDTKFEFAGQCIRCGENLYKWVEGPQNDEAIGNSIYCFVRNAGKHCKMHWMEWLRTAQPMAYDELTGKPRGVPDGTVVEKWDNPL